MTLIDDKRHTINITTLIVGRLPSDVLLVLDSFELFDIRIDFKNKSAKINELPVNNIAIGLSGKSIEPTKDSILEALKVIKLRKDPTFWAQTLRIKAKQNFYCIL